MMTGYKNITRWSTVLLVTVVSSVFLSACVMEDKHEEGSEHAISFFSELNQGVDVEGGQVTRADQPTFDPGIYSLDELLDKDIYIFGNRYIKSGSANWEQWGSNNLYFSAVVGRLEKKGTIYNLNYSPLKYWDPGDRYKHDFRMVYPVHADKGVVILPANNNDSQGRWSTDDKPKLYADLTYRPDLILAGIDGKTKADGYTPATHTTKPLGLNFEHQLSLVTLKIIKDPALEQNVYMDRITMTGPVYGVFDIVDRKWSNIATVTNTPVRTPGWPQPADFLIPDDSAKKIQDLILFNLPMTGSLKAGETLPMTTYQFKIWLNEVSYNFTLPVSGETWEKGYRYTYTLKVVGSDIYLEVDAPIQKEEWEDVDGGTLDVW